ncbi:MAG: ABC transporter substrate-binding protein, partial [Thermomicrobiales bacterium]
MRFSALAPGSGSHPPHLGARSPFPGRRRAQEALWDKALGAEGPWPEVAVPEPTEEVTLSVAHAWDATFMQRQDQFDELFTERHPNIRIESENTTFADYLTKYTTQAAGGSLPDVMYT